LPATGKAFLAGQFAAQAGAGEKASCPTNQNVRVTHQDIAQKMGCDKSTVSLALRGSPRIPESTRRKIRQLAKELGYRPDPALAMLARQRWARHTTNAGCTLAYIVNRRHSFYNIQAPPFAGARERARELGFDLVEFDVDEYSSGRAASRVLYYRGIRGLILSCILPNELVPALGLELDKFTTVSLSHGWGQVPVDTVGVDYFSSTRMVWHEVARRGYQRVGGVLACEDPVSIDDSLRLGASYVAQQELFPAEKRLPFLVGSLSDREAFLRWVRLNRPDAIISPTATVHYEWLGKAGHRVPGEIAFAGLATEPGKTLSGASCMVEKVGGAAVDCLIAQMHENRSGIPAIRRTLELEPRWVEGITLPDLSPVPIDQFHRAEFPPRTYTTDPLAAVSIA
jgi:LacI family transcriptional regulator